MMDIGVLVGGEASQEWLLTWFYHHFRKNNPTCPIAFADFGLSTDAQNWCKERGPLFQAPKLPILPKDPPGALFNNELWQEWKLELSQLAPGRWICFRKPLALALSPFKRTLWLDLDCQVMGPLDSLLASSPPEMGLVPCGSFSHIKNLSRNLIFLCDKYNTGVILVERYSPLLADWISLIQKPAFRTDEGSLALLIQQKGLQITQISNLYNWPVYTWGENSKALIYHWLGSEAKAHLRTSLQG